jgi:hypothetical protein
MLAALVVSSARSPPAYLACSAALPEDGQYNVVPKNDASTVGGASCLSRTITSRLSRVFLSLA